MTTKSPKTGQVNIPNYKTLEWLSTPNFKSLAILTLGLLAFGMSDARATSFNGNTGAGASIPSTSQQNFDPSKIIYSPSSKLDDIKDNGRLVDTSTWVQEDPHAGERVMPREKPVSYFKRDAKVGLLPKR